jgi:hypothetical protein
MSTMLIWRALIRVSGVVECSIILLFIRITSHHQTSAKQLSQIYLLT